MQEQNIFPMKGLVMRRVNDEVAPHFVCQYCNELIEEAFAAGVVWDRNENEALFVHKECEFEKKQLRQSLSMSMELPTFMAYLLSNTGLDEKELKWAREIAVSLERF